MSYHKSRGLTLNAYVINKWMRPDGPNPPDSVINWYNRNLNECNRLFGWDDQLMDGVGVAAYLQAYKDHENEGNHTASNGAGSGHHAQMRKEEEYFLDLRLKVENNYSKNIDDVKNQTYQEFIGSETLITGDPNHVWVEENWCPNISEITEIYESTFVPDDEQWTACECKYTDNF